MNGNSMKLSFGLTITLAASFALSACSGQSTSPANFATLGELGERLDPVIDAEFEATPDTDVPTAGQATFTGVGIVELTDPDTEETTFLAVGSANISVNFDDGTVSGDAYGFYDVEDPEDVETAADLVGNSIPGEFEVELTSIADGRNRFSGEIAGDIPQPNGQTKNADTEALGFFSGASADSFIVFGEAGDTTIAVVATED